MTWHDKTEHAFSNFTISTQFPQSLDSVRWYLFCNSSSICRLFATHYIAIKYCKTATVLPKWLEWEMTTAELWILKVSQWCKWVVLVLWDVRLHYWVTGSRSSFEVTRITHLMTTCHIPENPNPEVKLLRTAASYSKLWTSNMFITEGLISL